MAKQRLKQLEPSKMGFDGEEDSWVFVKKQRVIIVLPCLPLPEHFTPEKPANSQSQAELRDVIADIHETATLHGVSVVPPLPPPGYFILQNHATSRKVTLVHTVVSSQSEAELRDVVADTHDFHAVEPEACHDFTSVDKPEIVRKAPAPRRSLQDCRMNPGRRVRSLEIHRSFLEHNCVSLVKQVFLV